MELLYSPRKSKWEQKNGNMSWGISIERSFHAQAFYTFDSASLLDIRRLFELQKWEFLFSSSLDCVHQKGRRRVKNNKIFGGA